MFDELHLSWMREAFAEAHLAIGTSRPNPAVGAVLVKNGAIVGRGHTQKPGSHHAEIMALRDAGSLAEDSDLYVTLEPCSHWGRTPPCADAVVNAKVGRVFIAVLDGNPKVAGKGAERMRAAGIPVEVGLLADFAVEFYRGYHHHMRTGMPWVDVKIAQSLDGFIAGPKGERTQISCVEASLWVHQLRSRVDAIAVGGGTLVHDNPLLTVRNVPGNSPLRIIINRSAQLSADHQVFQIDPEKTWVFTRDEQKSLPELVRQVQWPNPEFPLAWKALLLELGTLGCHRILLEAGATMAKLVLTESKDWNRLLLLSSPKILGNGLSWSSSLSTSWKDSLLLSRFELIGCDFLAEFEHVYGNHTSDRDRQ